MKVAQVEFLQSITQAIKAVTDAAHPYQYSSRGILPFSAYDNDVIVSLYSLHYVSSVLITCVKAVLYHPHVRHSLVLPKK